MKKTALLLMILTILSKVFGFARELALSYFFGASYITDAFLISMTIPSVIFGFIGVGIATGYIPMYTKIHKKDGSVASNNFTNNLVNVVLAVSTILFIFGIIFTAPLVKVFASGFEGETLELAIRFTRISLIGIYFSGLMYIFSGYLQVKGNYTIPALVGFPMNLVTILAIIIASKGDIIFLAIGTVLASASQILLMIPFIRKKGFRYKPIFDLTDRHIKNMVLIALPVIIGVSVNQINVLVDRTLASRIAEGGISALSYAQKLNGFVMGIVVVSITTALYPLISKMVADEDINGLKKSILEAMSIISLLVIPATVGSMIFAEPIVRLLFDRGEFDSRAIMMTSSALLFYSLGIIGFGLRDVLSRAFYSMQDTKTPAINAAIAVALNIVLNIVLSRFMGLSGLALATSISAIFGTFLLFVSLRKKIGSFGSSKTILSFVKIIAASLIMGLAAKFAFVKISASFSQNLALIIAIAIGGLVYVISIFALKLDEAQLAIELIKGKVKSKKSLPKN